ncbi:MAG: chitobiase/beta-hexosaminidase C-terminal domain-containing protein [Muribaculaceae bacterium]|nr:chitobiase/beta-hexosaminidase C-terminal domain-containing protein [Muribaculaceae bacterium]
MMMMMPHASYENLLLSLSVWDESGSIWYTFDQEATPEDADAWTLYTEPLVLESDCTVRFFARRIGFLDSQIATYDFVYADWQVAAPEITEDSESNTVVISCQTEGAEIRYTLDGTEPTGESALYTEPIEMTSGMIVRARAYAYGLFGSEISELTVGDISGVETVVVDGIKVCKEGGEIVVYSDKDITLPVYTMDGRVVRTVNAVAGRNVIGELDSNIYIIGNVRIKL